jgi:hypothetical protein
MDSRISDQIICESVLLGLRLENAVDVPQLGLQALACVVEIKVVVDKVSHFKIVC